MTENLAKANAQKSKTDPNRKWVLVRALELKCLRSISFLLGFSLLDQASTSLLQTFTQSPCDSKTVQGTLKCTPNFLYFSDRFWSYTFPCEYLSLAIMHLESLLAELQDCPAKNEPCLITAGRELDGKKGVQTVCTPVLLAPPCPQGEPP